MPNPFPGMNPYLENAAFWPGFHSALINAIADALNAVLPPGFAADVEERLYVTMPFGERQIIPDVLVSSSVAPTERIRLGSAPAVVVPEEKPVTIWAEPQEVREPFVQVLSLGGEGRVVSIIELLSLSNKTAGAVGRRKYQEKQETLISGEAHFLEIDLLRGGSHAFFLDRRTLASAQGDFDYAACLHRSGGGYRWETWTRTVRQPLPRALLLPLTNNMPDAVFDLQALVNHVYDARRYEGRIVYQNEPIPPLAPGDKEWADTLLKENGLL